VQLFLELYGFLSVTLRGFIIAAQSLTLGGLAFLALALPAAQGCERPSRRLLVWSARGLCLGEIVAALSLMVMLRGTLDLPIGQLLGADAVIVDLVVAGLAGAIAFFARGCASMRVCALLCAVMLAVQVGATHAASRPDRAATLYVAEFAHMLGVGAWIGGIPYFIIALARMRGDGRRLVAARFSAMSLGSVALLIGAGAYMAVDYVGEPAALYGTSYGVMLCAKIALLGGLLLLGGLNFLAVRRLRSDPSTLLPRTRRFAEVEIGVGLTAIFCAASLTSLPPARDLPDDRATLAEIVQRVEPSWPVRLEGPDHASLSTSLPASAAPGEPRAFAAGEEAAPPRNAADIAWSEYNHHWAGLFVLLMGALALAEHIPLLAPVARHWPLTFLGLALFLFLRADETVWPLGNLGLIESLSDPEIAQHRLFISLIILFGLFEWRVRLGQLKNAFAPYVFPTTTAIAVAFLLTHSHGLANPKEELLIEVSHTPLALIGVAAGWARWLELRLDGTASRIASYVWPIALMLAGLLLLFYREA
jgi:putative copper resistance protein D